MESNQVHHENHRVLEADSKKVTHDASLSVIVSKSQPHDEQHVVYEKKGDVIDEGVVATL